MTRRVANHAPGGPELTMPVLSCELTIPRLSRDCTVLEGGANHARASCLDRSRISPLREDPVAFVKEFGISDPLPFQEDMLRHLANDGIVAVSFSSKQKLVTRSDLFLWEGAGYDR